MNLQPYYLRLTKCQVWQLWHFVKQLFLSSSCLIQIMSEQPRLNIHGHNIKEIPPFDCSAKLYLPVCNNPSKKELFFYFTDQLLDAMSNDCLHLSTGPLCYFKFCIVMEGSLCLLWQTILANQNSKIVEFFWKTFMLVS